MKKFALVLAVAGALSAPMCLAGCGASLPELTQDAEDAANQVDVGAQKVQATISVVRAKVQPYAQLAVQSCAAVKLDEKVCAELDSLGSKLARTLDQAQAALDLYNEGKGDFLDAFNATEQALELAKDYAEKVMSLVQRARA